jgi:GWxTD domain-containing protein
VNRELVVVGWSAARVNLTVAAALTALGATLSCGGGARIPTPDPTAPDLPTRSTSQPIFYVDTTTFLGEGGAPAVRMVVSIPYNQLHFSKRQDGGYEASFDIVAVFYDDDRRQAGGDIWRQRVDAEHYRDTSSQKQTFSFSKEFSLSPGEYILEVKVSSVGGESGSVAARRVIIPPAITESLAVSSLEIGTCADSIAAAVQPEAAVFTPSLTRRFGDPLPWVCARAEVFARGSAPDEPLGLKVRILGARDQVEKEERVPLASQGERTRFAVGVPIRELGPGTYKLELVAERAGGSAKAFRIFEIDASRIDVERNYADYVELARYFLGDEEIRDLRDVPAGERRTRWAEFWKERDPDPDTPENERLDEFLARVRAAADRYAARGEPGWRTDRGKVYVRYGEPDDVEQVAPGFNTPAYEIWRYVNRNLTFVFADSSGFGDFVLVQPAGF